MPKGQYDRTNRTTSNPAATSNPVQNPPSDLDAMRQQIADMQEAMERQRQTIEQQVELMDRLNQRQDAIEPEVTVEEVADLIQTLPEGTKRYRATARELKLIKTPGKKFLFEGESVSRDEVAAEFVNGVFTTDDKDLQAYIEGLPEFTGKNAPHGEPRPRIYEDELAHLTAPSVPVASGVRQSGGSTPTPESLTAPVR